MRRPSKKSAAKKKTSKTKKTSKAQKTTNKKTTKKKATKKKSGAKSARAGLARAALGCCTLVGSGPDVQFEGMTSAECAKRAAALGKNPIWSPGKCAEPD